jgi:RHH-type proline utilization regulon transcriptional repressor/proline dehydrogenase/delta 1-pyrroline-5-carboxylate dehydrogenase
VKYGVKPGSYTHNTEFFGPVLGVIRFERLEEAIEIVNATGYGLTSAIHSLDDREVALWKSRVRAGNLYINRGTTGAIVLRQPFGGMGKSCFGAGMKAGGPSYVAQFLKFEEAPVEQGNAPTAKLLNADLEALRLALSTQHAARNTPPRLLQALASYDHWWQTEFSREHDHFHLLGQDNVRRYLPFHVVHVRLAAADTFFDVVARIAAARITGARVVVSHPPRTNTDLLKQLEEITRSWAGGIEFVEETDAQLVAAITDGSVERIRTSGAGRVSAEVLSAAAKRYVHVASDSVLAMGRVELLWYLREQSVSYDYHRYGNLGSRAAERRREPE